MKQGLLNNIKNIYGWKTKRKIVVFSVDDYGNIFLRNGTVRKKLDEAGSIPITRFDYLDALETREDLEMLFETLEVCKDKNGRSAIFTAYAMPCNIDFDAVRESEFREYHYELLPTTFKKLASEDSKSYDGTWDLWNEGMKTGFMVPQFHGREHLNLKIFNEKLNRKDPILLTALENNSYATISTEEFPTMDYTAAFDFWDISEIEKFKEVIIDGIKQFTNVFGKAPKNFAAPMFSIHQSLYQVLAKQGIKYMDTSLIQRQHQGSGKYTKSLYFTGKKSNFNQIFMVRNVVFEPTDNANIDSVALAMKQIEAAFFWNRPAIISSHRVNFCGHIDPKNREKGLGDLKQLLKKIVHKWPEVEFMSADQLGDLILNDKMAEK